MYRFRYYIIISGLLLSTGTFAQTKKLNMQLIFQPGPSFVSGKWRNVAAYDSPHFPRKLTPGFETGINWLYSFKGRIGSKVVNDEMYSSGSYLSDKMWASLGVFYSMGGQSYKKMEDATYLWSRKLRLSYLKMPLKFYFIKGKKEDNQLVYTAGFYVGYLVRYKEKNSSIRQDDYTVLTVAHANSFDSTVSNPSPVTVHYEFNSHPYHSIDYGFSLGVGVQKRITEDISAHLILTGQIGLSDIKDLSAQYGNESVLYPYYSTAQTVNTSIPHSNRSLGVAMGVTKFFEWTPAPKGERKRLRFFRLKGRE